MAIRKNREEWDVYNNVFDQFTNNILRKLEAQGHFDELLNLISLGKEGNVFLAKKDDGFVCVKIYRLQTCDFNKMYDYLKFDPKYIGLAKRRREVIFAWAQKEYRNLLELYENRIKCPKPITYMNHVVVMEFIGDEDGNPAKPLIKDYPEDGEDFYNQVKKYMLKLHKSKIVHGDLSEYNILNKDGKAIIIDVSQSTGQKNFNYYEYLRRDCKNVARFFRKLGVETTEDDLYNEIFNSNIESDDD